VKLQGRIARPFQVSIPEFRIEKGRITDDLIRRHIHDAAKGSGREDIGSAGVEKPSESGSQVYDSRKISFLRDVQEYPDSGIAARYKRLGISVRQGQKLKAELLEKGLIEEQQQTTAAGRLNVLGLTAKGRDVLAGSPQGAAN